MIASHPETPKYLADKFLKENGVSYSKVEGSLLGGISLYDINYTDAIVVDELHLKYNIFMLFNLTPTIQRLEAHSATIDLKNLPKGEETNSTLSMFPFAFSQLHLSDIKVLFDDKILAFDLNASKVHHKQKLDVNRLSIHSASPYGDTNIKGKIKDNRLVAKSFITPNSSLSQRYTTFFQGFPQIFIFDLEATLESVKMHTHLDHLELRADQNLSLDHMDIDFIYFIKENYLDFNTSYSLAYDKFGAKIKQKGHLLPSLAYTSKLNATMLKQPVSLPFKTFRAVVSGDVNNISSKLYAGPLEFSLHGKAYKEFLIHAQSKGLPLSFISGLPKQLEKNIVSISADARLDLSPFSVQGNFATEDISGTIDGKFELNKDNQLYLAKLHPKTEAEVWSKYPIEKFSPLQFVYYNQNKKGLLNMDANMLNLTLLKRENSLRGWGNIGSAYFDTYGSIADNDTNMTLSAKVRSLDMLLGEFGLKDPANKLNVDAEVDINTTIRLSQNAVVKSRINLPWYIIKTDTQTTYKGEDLYFESTLIDKNISIDSYSFNVMEHHIYSHRPSKVIFDTNGTIEFKEFWIYDNLLLTGSFDPQRIKADLRIESEHFNYESEEGNITLKADIKAYFESKGRQNIEGNLTLLDGVINYEPKADYTISDDIIIVQDIKPHTKNRPYVNIHINALKPIRYKTKDIDTRFRPDIILWQEPEIPLAIYGLVTIEKGEVSGSGKLFELDKSEIYFNGANPIDPYLNLNIHHQTLDYIDIEIFITNTLGSPVVILSSKPAMSQNDIMSYILFGEAASSAFDKSETATNKAAVSSLLLATGLKQIFNDTAGVNIDTLNILTNEEGTLGYEIGTRFNKNMRVVYKNDTISSVILQYSISRSIRLDIDVHETGQGVSVLYIKDF